MIRTHFIRSYTYHINIFVKTTGWGDTGGKLLLLWGNLEREEGLGNRGSWDHLFLHPSQKAQMHYFFPCEDTEECGEEQETEYREPQKYKKNLQT